MTERTVDLWQYLPDYLKQFRELEALFEAEKPQLQALIHNQIALLNDMFIMTATNEGLKRFEKILNLYPEPGESLELRRSNVLANWFSNNTYTLKVLLTRLQMLQGNNDVQLQWDADDCYFLHVITRLEQSGQVDSLYRILETMLPANIVYDSVNRFEISADISMSFIMGLSGTGTLFNTNDIVGTFPNTIPVNVGSGVSITGTLFMTNDIVGTFENEIPLNIRSGTAFTEEHFITD